MTRTGLGSALRGRRIVITRPAEKAQALAERLRSLGAIPIVFPTIRITPADPAPLVAAARELATFDWIVFTSANGVEAFFARLPEAGKDARDVGRRKVAAIGPVTAAALRERGVEPALVPGEYVAEAVLAAMGEVRGLRVLLPRADLAREALAAGLAARGAAVTEVAAYRTVGADGPIPDLAHADAVTFTSSSTVRHFLGAGAAPGSAKVVCIGPVTAATARELGLVVAAVASEYTEDGLIQALEGALSA
ncbi:MAG TPA: uroporphyrinogen-III synthase [Gemmatimonadales bacterium]|nr:uroporphyrinogen-III synthase [Gemmatimonadales bacterium]